MPDSDRTTTPQVDQPGNKTKPTEYRSHEQWDPVFDGASRGKLPILPSPAAAIGSFVWENCRTGSMRLQATAPTICRKR